MAAYGEKGDVVRFYEINPAVVRYSMGENPFFTYLARSPATVEIAEGDARLILERELTDGHVGKFDILVMDAFSSDSVPVHLLTREAFALYKKHLRDPDSVIAINISNRFLDFRDLVSSQAEELDMFPVYFQARDQTVTHSPSSWMILTGSRSLLKDPVLHERGYPWIRKRKVVWTDSFSNLYQILRW
jgi:spermidine synthase